MKTSLFRGSYGNVLVVLITVLQSFPASISLHTEDFTTGELEDFDEDYGEWDYSNYNEDGSLKDENFRAVTGKPFCYEKSDPICGPPTWEGLCNVGRAQSPINIRTERVETRNCLGHRLVHSPSCETTSSHSKVYIWNSRHTVTLTLQPDATSKATIMSPVLKGRTYKFSQLHFHFGVSSVLGSEHHINSRQYDAEFHIVFIEERFKEFRAAADAPDKDFTPMMIIMAPLKMKAYYKDNPEMEPVFKAVELGGMDPTDKPVKVKLPGEGLNLFSLLPNGNVFVYNGSIATPGCEEVVTNVLYSKPWKISLRQINILQSMRDKKRGMIIPRHGSCFRDLQPLNDRTILHYKFI